MSACIRRNRILLERLFKARGATRRAILNNAQPDFLNALCEIAFNILHGKIPLTRRQYSQLQKQKTCIRNFASKSVSLSKKKKKLVNQKGGGFIFPLLSAALPFISSLFTRS